MTNLFQHQLDIIREDPQVAGLFLGTGSGKTLVALSLARGTTLVICPKTQKEDRNWEREAMKNKLKIDLTVMSKEEFRKLCQAGYTKRYDTVIVDEAHTCLGVTPNVRYVKKQPIPKTSQLFEELGIYIMLTKPTRLYLCTATIMRSPMTVWGAAKLLGQEWNFYEFRDVFYFRLPMPGREVWTPKNDDAAKDRLAIAVRNLGYVGRLEDFFDVPDQTYKTIHLDLTVAQKARIKAMAIEYPEPIVRCGKIHQVENGVLAGDEFMAGESFENAKIDALLDLAIEFPRMVIFAKYRAQIDVIASTMRERGYKVLTLTGDTKERGTVIQEAKEATKCIFIAQAQISAGWELPTYPVMVFASRTYSFVDYDQAVGRIQRADHIKKNLYINLVVRGGVDEAVDKCLANKKDFNDRIYLNV
jgi:hypothetical protein